MKLCRTDSDFYWKRYDSRSKTQSIAGVRPANESVMKKSCVKTQEAARRCVLHTKAQDCAPAVVQAAN